MIFYLLAKNKNKKSPEIERITEIPSILTTPLENVLSR